MKNRALAVRSSMPALLARLPKTLRWLIELVFGPPLPTKLPERVRAIIAQQQETSEIVISFAQIGAVLFFGVFYILSPKAFPPEVPFQPIPWTLLIYGLFTLWRTKRALERTLSRRFLTASVVIDILVLMITIWSFHLQYGAPPEMYLKAPTLMYVFIMIALRALRFEPLYVILAGVTGAIGWTVLVGYAVMTGDQSMVTSSFLTYVTSHSVLIGAEVDKLVSILSVTGILALAISRARKILYRAALDGQAAADLSRFFAPEVAGHITSNEAVIQPGMADQRQAAIMFIDLRGFTLLSEKLEPAQVMALLSDYQDLVLGIVRQHRGSIDKFMGDGILASFGATSLSSTYAADACRALEQLHGRATGWRAAREARGKVAPEIAGAMTTGSILFGAVGSRDRLEYTVIGDTVNLAAKLEKHCKIERTAGLLPQTSLDLAIEQGFVPQLDWQARPARQVAGVNQALDLVALSKNDLS